MSCVLTLTSAAVIAALSLTGTSALTVTSLLGNAKDKEKLEEGLETVFTDASVLLETLQNEYDCHVNVISENEYDVVTNCGVLKYKRNSVAEAFQLYLTEIENAEGLIANIKSFELDYGRNVQAYTYAHIKENLSKGMTIAEEEVLEDDTLLLTINVE